MDWLAEIKVSPKAAAIRRTLTPQEFALVRVTVENMVLVLKWPVAEVAEAVLCGIDQPLADDNPLSNALCAAIEKACE